MPGEEILKLERLGVELPLEGQGGVREVGAEIGEVSVVYDLGMCIVCAHHMPVL